jgi:hypothetical protein
MLTLGAGFSLLFFLFALFDFFGARVVLGE